MFAATWMMISGMPALFIDLFVAHFRRGASRIPTTVKELLDAKIYSQAIGSEVVRVERAGGSTQLANTSGRDWFKVTYPDGKESFTFAKMNAGSLRTNLTMILSGVYKNDLNTMHKGLIEAVRPQVASPKTYCAKWSPSQFLVIMEDITKQGVTFPTVWNDPPCTKQQAKTALATLAKVHAHYLGRPPSCWNDRTRPVFPGFVGNVTLQRCLTALKDDQPITPYAARSFNTACWHMPTLRKEYSAARPLTMCHGDAHFGNMYIQKDGEIGLIDFQCVTQEHPMRDVTYFLACTYPADRIAHDERELLEFYLERLTHFLGQRNDSPPAAPTLEQCVEQQRLQIFYVMYAFVYSAGVGADLMDMQTMGRIAIDRICQTMERIGAEAALHRMLDRTYYKRKTA